LIESGFLQSNCSHIDLSSFIYYCLKNILNKYKVKLDIIQIVLIRTLEEKCAENVTLRHWHHAKGARRTRVFDFTRNRIRLRVRGNARLTRGAVSIFELVARENFATALKRSANRKRYACTTRRDARSARVSARVLACLSIRNSSFRLLRSSHRTIHAEREIYGNNTVKSRSRARRSTRGDRFCRRHGAGRASSAIAFDSGISIVARRCSRDVSLILQSPCLTILRVERSKVDFFSRRYSTFLFINRFILNIY